MVPCYEMHTAHCLSFVYARLLRATCQVDWRHENGSSIFVRGNLLHCVLQALQAGPLAMAMHQTL